jgi:hypothetical protein
MPRQGSSRQDGRTGRADAAGIPGEFRGHSKRLLDEIRDERGQPLYYETDEARHDKMVELVTRMLELKKQQSRARNWFMVHGSWTENPDSWFLVGEGAQRQ